MSETIVFICLLFLFILITLILGCYIYSMVMIDAKSRGIKNPKLWSVIAAAGQRGDGLLLYLFTRRKTTSRMNATETAQFQKLKTKIYCLLAVGFFLFLLSAIVIFRYN